MKRRLLVVEDEQSTRRLLEYLLQAHYDVMCVKNGKEATDWLEAGNCVDVIITDIEMPMMGGLELIESLKSQPLLDQIPIIVLSSEDPKDLQQKLGVLEVEAFLEKPVQPRSLFWKVEKSLGRPVSS